MTDTAIQTDDIEHLPQTLAIGGALLKAAREQKKLSVEDISSRLRLSVNQIQALENDDFSILPSAATMTRGFIRNYARLLEIDPEPVLQVYQTHASAHINHSLTIKSENILISSTQKPVWKKYIVSSLVILLLIGAWMIYMDYFHQALPHMASFPAAQTETLTAPAQPSTNEPMPEQALPIAERDAATEVVAPPAESNSNDPSLAGKSLADAAAPPSTATAVAEKPVVQTTAELNTLPAKPTTQLPSVATPVPNVAASPVSNQSQGQNQVVPPQAVSASNKPAKSALKIQFTFTETAWVSVLDADNKVVLNKTGQAGGQEKIEAVPPVKLVIGNANGTHLEVNNKEIDLTPYNKLNVVRLTLE